MSVDDVDGSMAKASPSTARGVLLQDATNEELLTELQHRQLMLHVHAAELAHRAAQQRPISGRRDSEGFSTARATPVSSPPLETTEGFAAHGLLRPPAPPRSRDRTPPLRDARRSLDNGAGHAPSDARAAARAPPLFRVDREVQPPDPLIQWRATAARTPPSTPLDPTRGGSPGLTRAPASAVEFPEAPGRLSPPARAEEGALQRPSDPYALPYPLLTYSAPASDETETAERAPGTQLNGDEAHRRGARGAAAARGGSADGVANGAADGEAKGAVNGVAAPVPARAHAETGLLARKDAPSDLEIAGLGGDEASAEGSPSSPWRPPLRGSVHSKRGCEHTIASLLGRWGNVIAWAPWLVVFLSIATHLGLACGVGRATFTSDSHDLYIAQRSVIADHRRYQEKAFGEPPSPFIFVMRAADGTSDVLNRHYLDKLMRLHKDLYRLVAPATPSKVASAFASADGPLSVPGALLGEDEGEGTGEAADGGGVSPAGNSTVWSTIGFQDLCARRFVHMRGHGECIVVSPLQLWLFSPDLLDADVDVAKTMSDAYREHIIDVGGRSLDVRGTKPLAGAQALISTYYLDVALEAFWDGRAATWEALARAHIAAFVEREGDVRVSCWSRHFNEEEASRFVRNDGYLIGLAFGGVLLYVCLSLSGWGCDPARARYMLALTALGCSGLALVSGLGVSSLLGIPITPISPLVCFTLLGVSVDDMIILTDAFDRLDAEMRANGARGPPGARAIGAALYEIGGAVTMTTLTTAATFLTGWTCDLPIYAYFCGCAAVCILALYHIQMTLFAALLLIDARRRYFWVEANRDTDVHAHAEHRRQSKSHQKVEAGSKASLLAPDHVDSNGVPTINGTVTAHSAYKAQARGDKGGCCCRSGCCSGGECSARGCMAGLSRVLSRRPVKVLVLLGYMLLVSGAIVLTPRVTVGLPQRQTIADGSLIGEFLDDLDEYWSGYTPTNVMLVFNSTNVSDVAQVAAVQGVLDDAMQLGFVLRMQVDWIERFGLWCACMRGKQGITEPLQGALPPPPECSIDEFLADGKLHDTCTPPGAPAPKPSTHVEDCFDNDMGFRQMNGGHSCASAKAHCKAGTFGWRTVRRYCPVTCGVCVPTGGHEANESAYVPRMDLPIPVPMSALGGKDLTGEVYMDAHAGYTALQAPFDRHGVNGYAYQIKYEFACMDYQMKGLSVRNLLTVLPVIFLCTCLFLHPVIALLSVLAVASIDLLLYGMMAVVGAPLNVITQISLLIALGLAIDYSCHLGHAYEHAPYATRKEKVQHAMRTIGVSILNAGGSTLLGTLCVSASRSALFRIFFIFVWGTIALGLFCGLIVMPCALATFGPVDMQRAALVIAGSAVNPWRRLEDEDNNGVRVSLPPPAAEERDTRPKADIMVPRDELSLISDKLGI